MSAEENNEWVLPAEIPFSDLKRKDLEECVYWLLDAMGAKDLEWRTGGSGEGAADGGRDLEARFFTPGEDGELVSQKWWIECKGRKGTVEPSEVRAAVNNALAFEGLDYIIITTNTQFSNPTREWVKEWQRKYPKPKVQLWDKAQLERYLSRHPDVVLRLFSQALSLHGRLQALESRFWNKLEFVPPSTLADIWKARTTDDVKFTALAVFALVANEFANGKIIHRPWAAALNDKSLVETIALALSNAGYLSIRSSRAGIDRKILYRTFAYLILVALDRLPVENVTRLVVDSLNRGEEEPFPDEVQEMLLMPIIDQLLSEFQDLCSSDCERIMVMDRGALTEDKDEVDVYWLRLQPEGIEESGDRRQLRIEGYNKPCKVGFPVNKDNGCPLFAFDPSIKNVGELLALFQRVALFRNAQAAQHREDKRVRLAEIKSKTHR